jgi:hypothetical protein
MAGPNTRMYDPQKLKTVGECRLVMQRAKQRGEEDIYSAVFKRQCEIVAHENDDPNDPLVRGFYETLAAYEQLLSEKNHSNTPATRTRQKIKNKGVCQSLTEWTRGKVETNGFKLLVEAGLSEYTAEFLVAKFARRFPPDVAELARDRLRRHNIVLPEVSEESAG